jgi:FG-GAP-like repeat
MTRTRTVSVASLSVLTLLAMSLSVSEWARAEISAAPIQFEAVRSYGESVSSHFPDIGDFNHDGKPEVTSSIQNADGTFTTLAGANIGLGAVDQFPVRDPAKTFRIADFNGDGLDDILQIPYGECSGDTRYHVRIFLNVGNGMFREDAAFTNLGHRGRGETALVADFNNDGNLDIFIPFYNRSDDPAKCSAFPSNPSAMLNHLLRNDSTPGSLKFTDVTAGSGVTVPLNDLDADGHASVGPAEGAQAADVNGDGLIDFLAGQRLYRNTGNFRFEDYTIAAGLPAPSWKNFEEGAKFIDWNNDGRLDIVSNAQRGAGVVNGNQNLGRIVLYEQAASCASGVAMCFNEITTGPDGAPIMSVTSGGTRAAVAFCEAFGMWGYDINNDGYEDLVVSGTADASLSTCGTSAHTWRVLLNKRGLGGGFQVANDDVLFREQLPSGELAANRVYGGPLHVAFADFDTDGRPDMVVYGAPVNSADASRMIALNRSPAIGTSFSVIVQDAAGRRAQQGRVLRATKVGAANPPVISRMIDGGSGYLTNSEYPVMIGTPDSGPYRVEVTLPGTSGQPVVVAATARSGEVVTITKPDGAHPGGQVDVRGRDLTPTVLSNDVSRYAGTAPTRLLDTRPTSPIGYSGPKPGAGATIELAVGAPPSPAVGPIAAALNITATDANGGFVSVYPCDQPLPTASSLNLTPGLTAANLVLTKLSRSGTVCIYTDQGTHLLADLQGFYRLGSHYVALQPERLLDTRPGSPIGYNGAKPGDGATVTVNVAAPGGKVPLNNNGVVLNVTGTEADAGYVTAYPCDAPLPTASNLNFTPGSTRPNLVIVKASSSGKVCLFTEHPAHLLADLVGYFPAGDEFTSTQPTRVLDTRPGSPLGYSGPRPAAGTTVHAKVVGPGLAPVGTRQVVVNVTATDADAGFLTVYPCGEPIPTASNLNVVAGDTRPNLVIASVVGSEVCIYTDSASHLIVDLSGWYRP